MPARSRRVAIALVVAAGSGAAAIAGTGAAAGDGGAVARETATAPLAVRTVRATGTDLKFSKKTLRAPTGRVRLRLVNVSDYSHSIAVKGGSLARPRKGKVVPTGSVSKVTVTLPPGRYTYYCTVFGHAGAGMKGTLTVTR